jgi:hypothetical protein
MKSRKLRPFKIEGVKNFKKKKPPNAMKTSPQTPTKFFVCCFVAIKVLR